MNQVILAVCFKKEKKKRRWMKEWLKKRSEYTHENLSKDLRLSEPSDFGCMLQKGEDEAQMDEGVVEKKE